MARQVKLEIIPNPGGPPRFVCPQFGTNPACEGVMEWDAEKLEYRCLTPPAQQNPGGRETVPGCGMIIAIYLPRRGGRSSRNDEEAPEIF